MTFKQRLPYFLGGLTIGIIFVVFVFGKKETTFDYGPNARVLKNIRTKERVLSQEVMATLTSHNLDTSAVSKILSDGSADIWNKERLDTCIRYNIKGGKDLKNMTLTIKNCDSTAYIEKILIE